MGRLKMLVNRLPGVKYVNEVRRGTEEQEKRADQLQRETAPIVANLKDIYSRNHFKELVYDAFLLGRRPS
jgi:hypothetical protein